ncbi:MAG: hypothetical protein F4X66_19370 [Chloroflexi bacterium]|nr:hypothetical protein [Chloroflexota bacterium]MYE40725.1 hypothetical protein [Chloroflexota bacterium]
MTEETEGRVSIRGECWPWAAERMTLGTGRCGFDLDYDLNDGRQIQLELEEFPREERLIVSLVDAEGAERSVIIHFRHNGEWAKGAHHAYTVRQSGRTFPWMDDVCLEDPATANLNLTPLMLDTDKPQPKPQPKRRPRR